MKNRLTHIDNNGEARMVDVGSKEIQQRKAVATGFISLSQEAIEQINSGTNKKGNVFTVAEVAGIQAAKRTYELIPLCHPLFLSSVNVKCTLEDKGVRITSEVKCESKTGVEMEALSAVSVALLTIYDMCKAVDKQMVISGITLLSKEKK